RIFWWDNSSEGQVKTLKSYYTNDTTSGFTDALLDNNGNLVTASTRILAFTGNKILSESFEYMTDQFTIDKKNRIWVAPRSNKLFCFAITGNGDDAKLTLLKKFESITPNSPRSITVDNDGNVWIGTRGEGVFCLAFDGLSIRSVRKITA